MIIVPEIETVVILTPRTGSGSLKRALLAAYPKAMPLYRHMEADGVPGGYDRWRRVGVVRQPVDRLWSLFKFIQTMVGQPEAGSGKWEPAYVEAQRRSVNMPFSQWIVQNQVVFTSPYDSAGLGRFWAGYTVRHSLPETRKSQFIYLRPDLGTEIYQFDLLHEVEHVLGVKLPHHNTTQPSQQPELSTEALEHMQRVFAWDFEATGSTAVVRKAA